MDLSNIPTHVKQILNDPELTMDKKMVAFMAVGVYIDWRFSLMLIPVAALGHFIGLRMHERMIKSDAKFKRWIGGVLIIVCMVGLLKVIVL